MNWEAIGAIGEILGALVVFLTLLYLARQIRESNRAARLQSSRDVAALFNEQHSLVASTASLAEAVRKLNDHEELEGSEYIQIRSALQMQFNAWSNYHQQALMLGQTERINGIRNSLKAAMQGPRMWEFWEYHRPFVGPDFRDFMDSLGDDERDA